MSSSRVYSCICCLIFLSFCCMQFFSVVGDVFNSLSYGQVLTHSQSLVSPGNNFVLGFFRAGNSSGLYLGIWYKRVSEQTIVWVGNRDQPLKGSSPLLTINNEGNLVIEDGRITYRVSEISFSQNTSAVLLDSGNFVLRNRKFEVLWQSFDYPSDNFLPGMKIGYSSQYRKVWSLTSWRTAQDPDFGSVELKMDPKHPNELFLMRGSELVWRSGPWLSLENRFSLMPKFSPYLRFKFHRDENQSYFSYSVSNSSLIVRYMLDESGRFKQLNWLDSAKGWFMFWSQPQDVCNVYAYCGSFTSCSSGSVSFCQCLHGFKPSDGREEVNPTVGCVRKSPLQCQADSSASGNEDRFLKMNNVKFPLRPRESKLQNADECKLACTKDCTCTAYAYNESSVCSLWNGDLLNLRQLSKSDRTGQTIFLKLAASEIRNPREVKKLIGVIAVLVIVAVLVLLLGFYILYLWRRRFKEKEEMEQGEDLLLFNINMHIGASTSESTDDEVAKGKIKDSWLPMFSFSSVFAATDNFSTENKLGEGGFGPVYKGKLLNGQEVAVKRLSRQSGQRPEELKNEMMLLAKLQHRNIVRVLGCCIEHGEKILVYEFMPNKSLDEFLFDPTRKGILDWGTRIRIIEGIAQGLLYLHQYSKLQIIHRNLKASNILLDNELNPKISDFGLVVFGGDHVRANTKQIVRTCSGYMSPEYAKEGIFSIKSDVYSFGVLALEILSSKRSTSLNNDSLNLIAHAWELWDNDRAEDLIDPKHLRTEASVPTLARYINVALLCVQEIAADRPSMLEVVAMLTNEHIILSSPQKPAVPQGKEPNRAKTEPEVCSVINLTVSSTEAP